MPILSPLKKTLIASAFVTPLVLGACSSEAEETTEAQNSDTTTTAAEQQAAAEEANAEGDAADAESGDGVEEDAAAVEAAGSQEDSAGADAPVDTAGAGNAADPATSGDSGSTPAAQSEAIDPAAAVGPAGGDQVEFAEVAPVEGGQPASEADRAEIQQLVTGMYDATSLHGILSYLPANTCSSVVQENGGAAAFDLGGIPDLPLESVPQYANANPSIDAVENVQVKGDTASASVTATSNGQTGTSVYRFQNEGGAWKFCD